MKITEILAPEMVLPDLERDSKDQVLKELAQGFHSRYPQIELDELAAVLSERERLGSTAIGDGIAIPHGKLRGVSKIIGAFSRHRAGVDFDSLDGNPTHIFFVLVAPEDSASLHLKALARVSRLLKDDGFRSRLMNAADPAEIYRLIKEEDSKY